MNQGAFGTMLQGTRRGRSCTCRLISNTGIQLKKVIGSLSAALVAVALQRVTERQLLPLKISQDARKKYDAACLGPTR